jgi:glycosyltransferase involved in cell wall biosynthesis
MPLGFKKFMLRSCSRILCVSEFTRERMIDLYRLPAEMCMVVNNCLDPFLPAIEKKTDKHYIRQQQGICEDDTLLFTLTRMKSSERYKGYDRVIEAMSNMRDQFPKVKYLLAGKYDQEEELYIRSLIRDEGMEGKVFLSGYIDDNDIPAYFQSADIYIMPSYREGFGIVFIEALQVNLGYLQIRMIRLR